MKEILDRETKVRIVVSQIRDRKMTDEEAQRENELEWRTIVTLEDGSLKSTGFRLSSEDLIEAISRAKSQKEK